MAKRKRRDHSNIQYVYVREWFCVQFVINSTSEWLLIARGKAKCNYAIHESYLSQIVRENMLFLANHKLCL